MKLLLDTNAYIRFRQGHASVAELVGQAERVLISAVVAGELLFGFHNGSRFEDNWSKLLGFIDGPHVDFVSVDLETADRFGRASKQLRRDGRPIPVNAVWIAAHAMQTAALLASYDRHFDAVAGLALRHLRV